MKRTFIISLIVGLVLAACSSNAPAADRGNTAGTPQPTNATHATLPPDNAANNTEQPPSAPGTPPPAVYFLSDPAIGLDQLSSYRLTLTIGFQGQRDGQPADWQDVYTRTFSHEPLAQFTTLAMRDENDRPLQLRYGSVDGAHYFQKGAEACQVSWGELVPGSEDVNPAAMLPPIATVKEVGQETVNGVASRHYSIAEESNGMQRTGKLWLAESGGYVVKYDLSIQADEKYFGQGLKGTQTFQYELTDINALHGVALLSGCPAVLTEIPAMPDAIDLERRPGAMSFATPSSLESVTAFYQDKMKSLGWTLLAQHTDNVRQPVLIFTRKEGEESALISLQQEVDGVWVAIQLSTPQPTSPATGTRANTPKSTNTPAPAATFTPTPSPTLGPTPSGCLDSETAEFIWPQLEEVQPHQIAPGGTVKIIASGGILHCGPSGWIESGRQFQLYLDDKPISMMTCYLNHCEEEFRVPVDTSLGTHVISVDGGSEVNIQVTAN